MGFGNISAARAAAETSQSSNRFGSIPTYKHELWSLVDNESVVVRFVGGNAEPHIFHQHGFARHPDRGFEKGVCLRPEHCPMCEAAAVIGEKRVKRATPYAAFTVYSTRQMLKIPAQGQDGKEYFKKEPLRTDVEGRHIYKVRGSQQTTVHQNGVDARAERYEAEDEGLKVWCGSLHPKANNADKLLALDMRLQGLCQCAQVTGSGLSTSSATVSVSGYQCEECGENVGYDPVQSGSATCRECGHVGVPTESVSCSAGCAAPKRGGLTKCYVRITRRGTGTDTRYDFQPLPFSLPEHTLGNKELKTIYAAGNGVALDMLNIRGIGSSGDSPDSFGGKSTGGNDVPW